MTSSKRRLRPGSASIVCMMAVNAVLSAVVLTAIFKLFGVYSLLPDLPRTMHGPQMPGTGTCSVLSFQALPLASAYCGSGSYLPAAAAREYPGAAPQSTG